MLPAERAAYVDVVRSNPAVARHRWIPYRYFKRIVAHLMNLLSAVTMPLDELDYFDEQRRRP